MHMQEIQEILISLNNFDSDKTNLVQMLKFKTVDEEGFKPKALT